MCAAAQADSLRIATWHVELERDGPGLLMRDIVREAPEVVVVVQTIADVAPDVILLTGIDWDYGGLALGALADRIGTYPHRLALRPNTGVPTGLDLDADGYLGGPGDAQGYARFLGHGGMALLSTAPIVLRTDHSGVLWSDQPGALLFDGMTPEAATVQRLFSVGLWEVETHGLHLIALSATPPVFDGPEDRNGRRNADELAYATRLLANAPAPFVVLGKPNLDPVDGDGRKDAIAALLRDPRLSDPRPASDGGPGQTPGHRGDPRLDTADWREPDPGNLRASYVLPGEGLEILSAGVVWPEGEGAPRHGLVWVDIVP